jgi:hypothetical protein
MQQTIFIGRRNEKVGTVIISNADLTPDLFRAKGEQIPSV